MNLQPGDLAGLLILGSMLLFFIWLGTAKRRLERRRSRADL
jgi:hypothetical protein